MSAVDFKNILLNYSPQSGRTEIAMANNDRVRGITVLNPTDIEEKYLFETVEYAKENGLNHIEIVGAIHDYIHGNIDGMINYRKYSVFNNEKDADYVAMCMDVVNRALDEADKAGIKTYIWHHELDLPTDFDKIYPEVKNENGDVEVSSSVVMDFLEHKISEFFDAYPKMAGIVLTLHETKVPLLKLTNQKLSKSDRIKLVVEKIFDVCRRYGKELIVRPFSSLAEDTEIMQNAVREISPELVVMEKWIKFDWVITLPTNESLSEIENPLIVETDISCEYIGKSRLPIMFDRDIISRYEFCEKMNPIGYTHRIDRNGKKLLGNVNGVNLAVVEALMNGESTDEAIDAFFKKEYPEAWREVKSIMEPTYELIVKLLHIKGFYFSQGSYFPDVNHSKNHFYIEMMREKYDIVSDEWFVPAAWERGDIESVLREKDEVVEVSEKLLKKLLTLDAKIEEKKYRELLVQFKNLYYTARLFKLLVKTYIDYARYFDTFDEAYEKDLYATASEMVKIDAEAALDVNDEDYYCNLAGYTTNNPNCRIVPMWADELRECFEADKRKYASLKADDYHDLIICGSGNEGHRIQKEVNFSDTLVVDGEPCRFPGNKRGATWSRVNAHGWFSYEVKVKAGEVNRLTFELGGETDTVSLKISMGDTVSTVFEKCDGKLLHTVEYRAAENEDTLRVRIDRMTAHTPYIFSIRVEK